VLCSSRRLGKDRIWLSRWLSRPECIAAARERAPKAVAVGALRSGARLNELVDCESSKTSLEAAKYSLATAGIGPPKDLSVNISIGDVPPAQAGYVIKLERMRMRRSIGPDGHLVETPIDDGPVIEGTVKPAE